MGNLLSLHPKIHRLRTDTKKLRGLANGHGIFGALRSRQFPDDGRALFVVSDVIHFGSRKPPLSV